MCEYFLLLYLVPNLQHIVSDKIWFQTFNSATVQLNMHDVLGLWCYRLITFMFQVFDEVQSLVTSCVDGFNVCIFAYGQTGSGKTFTMEVRNKWHLTHLAIDYFQTLRGYLTMLSLNVCARCYKHYSCYILFILH